jgi:hypothetical protein
MVPRACRPKSKGPNALKNGVEEDMFLDNIPNSFHPAKYILKPPYLSAILA